MAHGQGQTSNRTGGYGALARGTRGHGRDKAVKRAEAKTRDPRLVQAAEEVRQAQEELDALMERQRTVPALGEVAGARYARERREAELALEIAENAETAEREAEVYEELKSAPVPRYVTIELDRTYIRYEHKIDVRELPQVGDGNWAFSYQTARIMLKDGYNIAHVIKYTGIGYEDLADIPLDSEGYVTEDSLEGEEE